MHFHESVLYGFGCIVYRPGKLCIFFLSYAHKCLTHTFLQKSPLCSIGKTSNLRIFLKCQAQKYFFIFDEKNKIELAVRWKEDFNLETLFCSKQINGCLHNVWFSQKEFHEVKLFAKGILCPQMTWNKRTCAPWAEILNLTQIYLKRVSWGALTRIYGLIVS